MGHLRELNDLSNSMGSSRKPALDRSCSDNDHFAVRIVDKETDPREIEASEIPAAKPDGPEKLFRLKRTFLEHLYAPSEQRESWLTPLELWGGHDVFLNPKGSPLQVCVVLQGSVLLLSENETKTYDEGSSFIYDLMKPSWLVARKPKSGPKEFLGMFIQFGSGDFYSAKMLGKISDVDPALASRMQGETLDSLQRMLDLQELCEINPGVIRPVLRNILKNELLKIDNDHTLDEIEHCLDDSKSVDLVHFLRENFDEKMSGQKLSQELGIGQASMRKGGSVNLAPHKFQNTLRAVRASYLMSEKKFRVADAAKTTGFKSVRQFRAAFGQVYNVSPGAIS